MSKALRSLAVTAVATLGLVALAGGCNSILDNNPGVLVVNSEDVSVPDSAPEPVPDAGADVSVADAAEDVDSGPESPDCPKGQHICNGTCVSLTDPIYGCGDPSCQPCASTHSTMACQGNKCVVAGCDPGYSNCNGLAADGCETDLAKPQTCGSCNANCAPATPLCAASGSTFVCTNGCTPSAPVNCNNTCVNLLTNTNNCGACNMKCPVVPNSTATCDTGACGFTCKPQFHACAGKCPAKTDPTACGPDCTVCPVPTGGVATCTNDVCGFTCTAPNHLCGGKCVQNDPTACGAACTACPAVPNAAPTCAAEKCGFTCTTGYGDCNMNATDGCEASLQTDALNCGVCGKLCPAGKACVAGACEP
ncbi:MAG: Tryptophan synthase alpha chain [Labilithrix sp.]|nr:Tryptophan synthase alpha chain [Labilithrix sp.]